MKPEINISEIVSIISLSIALLALIFSIGDYFLARKALRISEMEANERNPNLIPYLIDGFALAFKNYKIFAFYFSVSNRSSNNNSITQLDLKILYNHDDHNVWNLRFRHDKAFEQGLDLPGHTPFSIPIEIDAYQTITGWSLFKVTEKILENKTIDNYEILIRDSHDVEVKLNQILIQERLMDEK